MSVVVIGRNEGERLVACLESVARMRWPAAEVEVIYVDSGSTDGSPERARDLGARVLTVRPERPCAAVGRNAGWRAARGEIVLFLDGDTLLEPDFVPSSMPEFDDDSVAVVWGHRREIRPESSLYNRVLDLDWIYPPGPSEFCGGDALMRRSVLEELDGYDETLIAGEEPELCRRMRERGHTILHVDRAMTGHDLAIRRFSQYWRRAVRTGHAYAEIAERFRGTDTPLWEADRRRNLVHGSVLLGVLAGGSALSAALLSVWPGVVAGSFLALLVLRTAAKVGWKSPSWPVRIAYGVHSHLQQIPILIGQLAYARDRRAGRRRGLIEYKDEAAASATSVEREETAPAPEEREEVTA